jgi:hypothetical protein
MPWPFARLARTCGAPALFAAALVCLGACASFRATPSSTLAAPTAPPTAVLAATDTPRPSSTISPAPPSVSGTATPSPDAAFLVYADQGIDQPIWVAQGTGAARVVAHGDSFRLSPDGRFVASVRGFPHELWIVASDGSGEELLYTAPMGGPLIESLLWAPDGRTIVFSLTCPGCPASQDPGALWRLDVATGAVRQLAAEGAHRPLFSPDSRWLSLASPLGTLASHGSVGLIDAVEGRGNPALFEYVDARDRAWAADSSGFVVAFAGMGGADVTELWWVPTSGEPVKLGQLTGVLELLWQPGGGRLVYRKAEGGGVGPLYLADRDGSGELPIPGSEGMSLLLGQFPYWSPDGRWLLAVNEMGAFRLVDTNTSAVHPLDVHVAYGWTDAGQYLAGMVSGGNLERYWRGDDVPIDVYRCAPLGACEWLAQVPRLAYLGYAHP